MKIRQICPGVSGRKFQHGLRYVILLDHIPPRFHIDAANVLHMFTLSVVFLRWTGWNYSCHSRLVKLDSQQLLAG